MKIPSPGPEPDVSGRLLEESIRKRAFPYRADLPCPRKRANPPGARIRIRSISPLLREARQPFRIPPGTFFRQDPPAPEPRISRGQKCAILTADIRQGIPDQDQIPLLRLGPVEGASTPGEKAGQPPDKGRSVMITAYLLENNVLDVIQLAPTDALPDHVIWLDAYAPDDDERVWLKNLFISDVPEEEELDDIEASSRFYQDKEGVHILSLFPQRIGNDTKGVNVSFTLRNNILLTFREEDIGVVRLLRHYMRHNQVEVRCAMDILLELQDLKVEYLSDLIEDGYGALEETSDQVLSGEEIQAMLRRLIIQEQTNTQIHLALGDTRRALRYVLKVCSSQIDTESRSEIEEVLSDIESLLPHTQFLFDKINFQLEAAMGVTNIQQNSIIKIFSVAAVVFMPPTWIASIYGMNFHRIPELEWAYGYPFAITLMFLSALGTYLFFRKKGWL